MQSSHSGRMLLLCCVGNIHKEGHGHLVIWIGYTGSAFILFFDISMCSQVRKRKWVSYVSGEELFGLPITQYDGLEKTEKEITMLDRLYT